MKKLTVILFFVIGLTCQVIGQASGNLKPGQYIPAEEVPQYVTVTETTFGADFDFSDKGAVIVNIYPNSPAYEYGFKKGDIVKEIGSIAITSETSYNNAMASYKPEESVKVTFIRKNDQKHKKVTLGQKTVYKKV